MTENYELRIKKLEERVEKLEEKTRWKSSISHYDKIITLKFETDEDDHTAINRLCENRGLPYLLPGTRRITIPAEAEEVFSDLSYTVEKTRWASDLSPEEEAESRKKYWYYP